MRLFRFYVSRLAPRLLSSSLLLLLHLSTECRMAVFPAGPQPPAPDGSAPRRTSTASFGWQCSPPDLDHESEDMPDRTPERMSARMSEVTPERMSEVMPERMPEGIECQIYARKKVRNCARAVTEKCHKTCLRLKCRGGDRSKKCFSRFCSPLRQIEH